MAEVTLTVEQLLELMTQHRDALAGKIRFLDIVMPNGETLANCAGDYIWQVGTAMSEYASGDLVLSQMPAHVGNETVSDVDKMLFGTN